MKFIEYDYLISRVYCKNISVILIEIVYMYFANNQFLGLCTFLFTLYVLQTTHVYKDIFFRNEFIFYAPAWCRVAVLLVYTGCKWVMCLY